MDTSLNTRFRVFLVALSATTLIATACDLGPVEPVGRRQVGTLQGGGTNTNQAIAGTWQRTLVFFDEFGFMHSSETTWTFDPGGQAERSIVTTNVTLGASDTSLTQALWRLEGTNLIIDFTAPASGTITLEARVQDSTLLLAGQEYQRIE
jgi:hypothetical protein